MKDKILIVGGHGHVGSVITRALASQHPKKIVLAGRDIKRLQHFKHEEQLDIELLEFDIYQRPQPEWFVNVALVVVCIDQKTASFAVFCQEMAIDYLDVSANTAFYQLLDAAAFNQTTGVVYSVGIAPGVTNLMANQLAQQLPDFEEMAIKVILGLADQHGDAAIDWTLSHLSDAYKLKQFRGLVKTFSQKKRIAYDGKKLPVYNFNFSDQHSLSTRWPDKFITTYLGFDLKWVTTILYRSQQFNVLRLLERPWVKKVAKALMKKGKLGTDLFCVQVTARNGRGQEVELTIKGHNEAYITGKVAAYVANRVYQSGIKGFVQIEDVCELADVLAAVPELIVVSHTKNASEM